MILRVFLNLILLVILFVAIFNIVIYWIRKARKYRAEHGINFDDSFFIRLLSLLAVSALAAGCSVGIYYANKFGHYILMNIDELIVIDTSPSLIYYILKVIYSVAGQLVTTLSSLFLIAVIVTIFCAIDTYIICPKIKEDNKENDEDDEYKDI